LLLRRFNRVLRNHGLLAGILDGPAILHGIHQCVLEIRRIADSGIDPIARCHGAQHRISQAGSILLVDGTNQIRLLLIGLIQGISDRLPGFQGADQGIGKTLGPGTVAGRQNTIEIFATGQCQQQRIAIGCIAGGRRRCRRPVGGLSGTVEDISRQFAIGQSLLQAFDKGISCRGQLFRCQGCTVLILLNQIRDRRIDPFTGSQRRQNIAFGGTCWGRISAGWYLENRFCIAQGVLRRCTLGNLRKQGINKSLLLGQSLFRRDTLADRFVQGSLKNRQHPFINGQRARYAD